MKKRNKIAVLTFLFAAALTFGVACGNNDNKTERVVLQTPANLQINETVLTWDEVENAGGYALDINGNEKFTTINSYELGELIEPDNYSIRVKALGTEEYLSSEWSQVKEYVVESSEGQCLEYEPLGPNQYVVVGIGTVTTKEVVIPDTYNGKPVVEIMCSAFADNTHITRVVLPHTVRSINNFAFAGCKSLESVYLPDGLINIQRAAFANTGLKSIEIPDTCYHIPYDTFYNCLNLEYVKLPESLYLMPIRGFKNTPKLKSITIPASVEIITDEAFAGSSIESIKIPKKVFDIGVSAFENSVIKSIEFEEGSELTDIEKNAFKGCKNLTSIVLPASVTTIGDGAFADCSNLNSITFEENSRIATIGKECFTNTAITEFTIPKTLKKLGNMAFANLSTLETIRLEDECELKMFQLKAFYNCVNLTKVDFGKNCKFNFIANSALENCSKLETINLPKNMIRIGNKAFGGCTAMESIIIPATEVMGDGVFDGWTKDQTIYVELSETPATGWRVWLNGCNATVVWGYKSN